MCNPTSENPHIYFQKKYIALKLQHVARNPPPFVYIGNSGIQGCLHQLNNLNTTNGILVLLVSNLCHMFGIPSKHFFQGGGEDFDSLILPTKPVKFSQFTDPGLASLVKTVENTNMDLKLHLADLTNRMETIEKHLGHLEHLDKIVTNLLQLDPSKIDKILEHVASVDSKI